jgi:hypothetical protein
MQQQRSRDAGRHLDRHQGVRRSLADEDAGQAPSFERRTSQWRQRIEKQWVEKAQRLLDGISSRATAAGIRIQDIVRCARRW